MKKYRYEIAVILLIFFLILLNIIWLKQDTKPPHWDFAVNLSYSIFHLENLMSFNLQQLVYSYSYWPPLSYYITSVAFLLFGIHEDIGVLSLSPFLAILLFFTYKLGETLLSKRLGILSAVVLVGMPFLMSQTREYQLDFPLTAMVILNAYLFFKSVFFSRKKYSILFGIGSGLGLLTKWTYIIFLLISVIFGIGRAIKIKSNGILVNLIGVFILTAALAGPWYLANVDNLKYSYFNNIQNINNATIYQNYSLRSLTFYLNSLYLDHLRLPFLIFLINGVIFILLNFKKNKNISLILIFCILYFLIISLYSVKEPRYIEAITPFLAIIMVFWILKLKHKIFRKFLIFSVILLAGLNYFHTTFGIKFLPEIVEYKIFNSPLLLLKQRGYLMGPPQSENWFVDEIINRIDKDIESSGKRDQMTFVELVQEEDKMFFNKYTFNFIVQRSKSNIYLNSYFLDNLVCPKIINSQVQYFILSIDSVPAWQNCSRLVKDYKKLGDYNLRDGSRTLLLKTSL